MGAESGSGHGSRLQPSGAAALPFPAAISPRTAPRRFQVVSSPPNLVGGGGRSISVRLVTNPSPAAGRLNPHPLRGPLQSAPSHVSVVALRPLHHQRIAAQGKSHLAPLRAVVLAPAWAARRRWQLSGARAGCHAGQAAAGQGQGARPYADVCLTRRTRRSQRGARGPAPPPAPRRHRRAARRCPQRRRSCSRQPRICRGWEGQLGMGLEAAGGRQRRPTVTQPPSQPAPVETLVARLGGGCGVRVHSLQVLHHLGSCSG